MSDLPNDVIDKMTSCTLDTEPTQQNDADNQNLSPAQKDANLSPEKQHQLTEMEEDVHMMEFLMGDERPREPNVDLNEDEEQKARRLHREKIAAKKKETEDKKKTGETKVKQPGKKRENFTQLFVENQPKKDGQGGKKRNRKGDVEDLDGDEKGDKRGGKKAGKNTKASSSKDDPQCVEAEDEFGDEIVCPACKMYFKTQKKLLEHYKKNPEHDPGYKAPVEEPVDDGKPVKIKRKMHGHRGF